MNRVLELAKWMHEQANEYKRSLPAHGPLTPWVELSSKSKAHYKYVAKALLENPQPYLRRGKKREAKK